VCQLVDFCGLAGNGVGTPPWQKWIISRVRRRMRPETSIFDCGQLGEDQHDMRPDGVELDKAEWVPAEAIARFVIPRLVRRLTSAYRAYTSGATLYLEHGQASPITLT
jgi:hypothetical protein